MVKYILKTELEDEEIDLYVEKFDIAKAKEAIEEYEDMEDRESELLPDNLSYTDDINKALVFTDKQKAEEALSIFEQINDVCEIIEIKE